MRRLLQAAAVILLLAYLQNPSSAETCINGEMAITPHGSYYPAPIMLTSPATFNITTTQNTTLYFPHILLVMTKTSIETLIAPITVNWTTGSITFSKVAFQSATDGYIPPQTVTSQDTGRYSTMNLKERLTVNQTANEPIYYAYGPFLFGTKEAPHIDQTPQPFTVTIPSTNPRALILALARTPCSTSFNTRVKPCTPGFIVPEPAPILLLASAVMVLVLASTKHKRPQTTR